MKQKPFKKSRTSSINGRTHELTHLFYPQKNNTATFEFLNRIWKKKSFLTFAISLLTSTFLTLCSETHTKWGVTVRFCTFENIEKQAFNDTCELNIPLCCSFTAECPWPPSVNGPRGTHAHPGMGRVSVCPYLHVCVTHPLQLHRCRKHLYAGLALPQQTLWRGTDLRCVCVWTKGLYSQTRRPLNPPEKALGGGPGWHVTFTPLRWKAACIVSPFPFTLNQPPSW